MIGDAHKRAGHIMIVIIERDIPKLYAGKCLESITRYEDLCIKKLKFKVVNKLPSHPKDFIEPGFSVTYYPNSPYADHTICYVKIDTAHFETLLGENWIGTRHHGFNHLHICYNKTLNPK